MKFSKVFSISALVGLATAAELTPTDIKVIKLLLGDIDAHFTEYVGLIATGQLKIDPDFLNLIRKVRTYTDDSFTTILPDFDMSTISNIVTQVPWYSERLAPEISKIEAEAGGASSAAPPAPTEASSSTAPSEPAPSEPAPSEPAPSEPAPSEPASHVEPPPTSVPEVATQSHNGAANLQIGVAAALAGVVGLLL